MVFIKSNEAPAIVCAIYHRVEDSGPDLGRPPEPQSGLSGSDFRDCLTAIETLTVPRCKHCMAWERTRAIAVE